MPNAKPWLSVIIPTYNGEPFLAKALLSMVEQEDHDFECIIVDDGSSDSTIQIINSFVDKIHITLHQVQRTGNWVASSNFALSHSNGDYACFLHQDDFWLANRLKVIKELIRRYPETELVLCPAIFVNENEKIVGRWHCPLPKTVGPVNSELLRRRLIVQNFIAIPSPVFKRKTALACGGLDESLWYTADWDFWLKLADCNTVYYPRPLAAFRIHSHSQTVKRSFDVSGFQQQLETVLYRYVERFPVQSRSLKLKNMACFSIQLNAALAARIHGGKIKVGILLASFLKLGPIGWWQYLRDSRITERIMARLRARIAPK